MPPYPYWPPERVEENSRLLQQELQGRSPAGGIEVRVMRKDGVLFDARDYAGARGAIAMGNGAGAGNGVAGDAM